MDSPWFIVSLMATIFAVGNILFGHFEEHTPKWRRILKFVAITGGATALAEGVGRAWLWGVLALGSVAVVYIHFVILPRHGIHPLTGEPRERYYEFRGWRVPPPPRP